MKDLIEIQYKWSSNIQKYIVPGLKVSAVSIREVRGPHVLGNISISDCVLSAVHLVVLNNSLTRRRDLFLTGFSRSSKYLNWYTQVLSITKITHIKRTQEVKYFSGSRILFPFLEH
jgi:hypothetical protein